MTKEVKKTNSMRRWREQQRRSIYCAPDVALWLLMVVSCFLISRAPLSHSNNVKGSNGDLPILPVRDNNVTLPDGGRRELLRPVREVIAEIELGREISVDKHSAGKVKAGTPRRDVGHRLGKRSEFIESSTSNAVGLSRLDEETLDILKADAVDEDERVLRKGRREDFWEAETGEEDESLLGHSTRVVASNAEVFEEDLLGDTTEDAPMAKEGDESFLRQGTKSGTDKEKTEEEANAQDEVDASFIARTTAVDHLSLGDGLKRKAPNRSCAEVEEMGLAASGDTNLASLRLRRMIRSYLDEHGAKRVRQLPPNLFCERSFVLGKAQEDGFGNNMYKLLTAAGLGVILNRSLIIGEASATIPTYVGKSGPLSLPFGSYVSYSDETFSMREVKQLWAKNDCSGHYNRSLVLKVDSFDSPAHSSSLCEDWTKWTSPIIWFKGTSDTVALQYLLKNQHPNVRSAASMVLGDPSNPDSRPNTFGELMMLIVEPKPEVRQAVDWALQSGMNKGAEPDIALHLRMRQSSSRSGPEAASACITRIISLLPVISNKRPRIVVVSDTTSVLPAMKRFLKHSVDVITFNYQEFLSSSSEEFDASMRADFFLPPPKRRRDWGSSPRWVAVVDFFLAARARHAVVSGAHRRVGTTYAQLVASLAAAYTLDARVEHQPPPTRFYSSFQASLLEQGLVSQGGWGHSWRPFGGNLSCHKQQPQCALTPLLPYAWWDGPWQSPSNRDQIKMRQWGITINSNGKVTEESVQYFCRHRKKSTVDSFLLALPK